MWKELLVTALAVMLGIILANVISNTLGQKLPIISHYDDTYDNSLEEENTLDENDII